MSEPFPQASARNSKRECKVSNCREYRHLVSGYCKEHHRKYSLYADPLGRTIKPKEYLKERQEVSALIQRNLTHVATAAAIGFIQGWLDKALAGGPCQALREMQRLALGGVTALEILTESAALFHYSERYPHQLSNDTKLSFQIALACFRLSPQGFTLSPTNRPMYRKPRGADRRAFGETMRKTLGLYFINISNTIRRKEEQEANLREKLWTPLE